MKIDKFSYKQGKEIIIDVIDKLGDDKIIPSSSFIDMYNKKISEMEKDIEIIKNELLKKGINLFQFIGEHEASVFSDQDFCARDALMDTILYLYDNEKGILGGNKLIDSEEEEYFIKYKYGYYNYEMGLRYLLQSFDSLDDYYKFTANTILYSYINSHFGGDKELINDSSIIKEYTKGYTVYCDLELLYSNIEIRTHYDNFVEEINEDLKEISHVINNNILEIYIGYKNKISSRELKKITDELNLKSTAKKYNM